MGTETKYSGLTYEEALSVGVFYRDCFSDNPYVHNNFDAWDKVWSYQLILVWRAFTPGRRPSKFFHARMYRKSYTMTDFYSLPRLKKGYMWSGPYILEILNRETGYTTFKKGLTI